MLTEFIRSYSKYISSSHFIFYISIIVGSVQKYLRLPVHTINSLSYHERKCLTKLRFGRCSSHWNSISRKIVLLKTSVDHIINSLQLLVMTSKILLDNNKQVFFFFFRSLWIWFQVVYEYMCSWFKTFLFHLIMRPIWKSLRCERARSLVVSDLRSETKDSRFDFGS